MVFIHFHPYIPMYTAEATAKTISEGGLTITVRFSDGTNSFTEDFYANSGMDDAWLQNRVKNRLEALNSLKEFSDSLSLGAISTDVQEPQKPAAQVWVEEYILLKRMQSLVSLGIVSDTDVAEQEAKVKDSYKAEFINSVPLL